MTLINSIDNTCKLPKVVMIFSPTSLIELINTSQKELLLLDCIYMLRDIKMPIMQFDSNMKIICNPYDVL